jgi:hypothetical protein
MVSLTEARLRRLDQVAGIEVSQDGSPSTMASSRRFDAKDGTSLFPDTASKLWTKRKFAVTYRNC